MKIAKKGNTVIPDLWPVVCMVVLGKVSKSQKSHFSTIIFRECRAKATEAPCPGIRDCGDVCCAKNEYCAYNNGAKRCEPLFVEPVCPTDRECGPVCCPEGEFCSILSMPM